MSSDRQEFQGVNAAYVEELYERFQRDPQSVDAATRAFFETWSPAFASGVGEAAPQGAPGNLAGTPISVLVGAVNLAQSIRRYGHLAARIDPLGARALGDPSLALETHRVTERDLRSLPATLIAGPIAASASSMWEVVLKLRAIYCGTTGYDFAHIFVP
ncbi:MAG TPA: hypothetical protein VLT86_05825, partial [Vicinamibacterales bacterium]|nr:hypothetical protein [Vicinamibacterales bacterium]